MARSDGPARPGRLQIVATPIGNLGDLSRRAREALEQADLVVAEDTRRTGRLLAQLGLSRPQASCHRFNEAAGTSGLVERLASGARLALVTDSGTPAISDPGHRLVAAASKAGIAVEPIPGPCAAAAALSVSGFPADRFHFAGFLPSRRAARQRAVAGVLRQDCTTVLYEAPHRLVACLEDLSAASASRAALVCRELTKLHEELVRGTLADLATSFAARETIRGEIVIVVAPPPEAARGGEAESDLIGLHRAFARALAGEQGDVKRALRRLSLETGEGRAELKRRLGL